MFRDASEELARLEAELLAEEEDTPEQPLPKEEEYFDDYEDDYEDYPVYTDGYDAYNTDVSDEDLDTYSETVREGKASRGLLVTALILCLLTLAVLSAIVYLYTEGYLG